MPANVSSLKILPNPVVSDFKVEYTVNDLSSVEFIIYDMMSNPVEIQRNNYVHSYSGEFNWILKNDISPGVYLICMYQKGIKIVASRLIKI